jgi:signal peptidase II
VGEAAPETPPRNGARTASPDIRMGVTPDALTPVSFAERHIGAGTWEWIALALVAGASIAADQATKRLVSSHVALGHEVDVLGLLSIHRVENSGIAFGFFPTATSAVIALTAAVVAWMLYFFARSGARHPVLPVGLGLVLGGSISNLVDRVRLGAVTDFLDVGFWPAFNLADTFIVVGVAVLLATLFAADRHDARRRTEASGS